MHLVTQNLSKVSQIRGAGRSRGRVGLLAALALLALAVAPARAQESGHRGVDVFDAVCANCHVDGEQGAPRIGDRAAWSKRASLGLDSLTRSVLEGIRNMPPHRGDAGLSRVELQRAIAYIVNESGGNWVEPAGPGQPAAGRSAAQVVQSHCVLCHATGFDGAPRIGDRAAWLPYTKLGLDPMVRKVVRGHGKMPPRGAQATLTDAELRSAVIYMISLGSARIEADRKKNPGR